MPRSLALFTVLLLTGSPSLFAQIPAAAAAPLQIASVASPHAPGFDPDLPDAPEMSSSLVLDDEDQAGIAASAGKAGTPAAPKYAGIILPGQTAAPLTAGEKVVYSFHDAFNLYQLLGITVSAGYSQLADSSPHYGQDGNAFGKREGVAALRNTVQTLSTDALFSPIFRTDPRYYEFGRGHSFFSRAAYAATRVVVARSDSGHSRLNAPLLLGYGVAAGLNNLYFPDQDTGGSATAKSYATSLAGAALGFEANEFLDDALRVFHLRK